MARVPAYTVGKNLWGDITLDAAKFLDDIPKHVHPVAADLSWNMLQSDYFSQTDTASQNIASYINQSAAGVSKTFGTAASTTVGQLLDTANEGVYFASAFPGIILAQPSTLFFLPTLLSLWASDTNKLQSIVLVDPTNLQGFGTNAIIIGDNASNTVGNQTTGNIKFLGAGGSTFDTTSFTVNEGPLQGTTKTKAGLPVAADIPAGNWAVYKDTTGGSIRLWANDGGTMKSVALA